MTLTAPGVGAPPAFHVMVKPRGPICNLACRYCYYLPKSQLYPGSRFETSDALLEVYTRQYIASQRIPDVTFAWQGGEPTLAGLAFFRRAVELQEKYRRPGMRITNALQTNGTTLDHEWCGFLREHDFLVGISLDGPAALHDPYRVDKIGQPTHARVMAGLALLRRHGVEFNILATVHATNAGHPLEVYRFLRDEAGAQFIQFIPIVERCPSERPGDAPASERSVTGDAYGRFLIAVFDEWVRRDVGRIFVQTFDAALGTWLGQGPGLCVFEETCGTGLAMEHNGDVYACDHFVEPSYRLGNLRETSLAELVASERQRRFGLAKRDELPDYCRRCSVRFACNGGCPKDRLLATPDGEPGLNYLCGGFRAFFAHVDLPMRRMAEEVRAGRPAAGIMVELARADADWRARLASAGRNDPCPCGSGRKYKHCHGHRQASGSE
jgi:uncharacterized protein